MSSNESSLAKSLHHLKHSTQFSSMPENTRINFQLQQKQSLNPPTWMIRWIPPSMSRMLLMCIINYHSFGRRPVCMPENGSAILPKSWKKFAKIVSPTAESALIAQTSICARFHQNVLVSKFGFLKGSESIELCPLVALNCFLLFVASLRLTLHWSPESSISDVAKRNDKAKDNFSTTTTWGLRRLSGDSYSYFSSILLHATYSSLLIPTSKSFER